MRLSLNENIFRGEVPRITEGMLSMLSENRHNHPEFGIRLSEQEVAALPKIQNALLELPLLHRTSANIPDNSSLKSSRGIGRVSGIGKLDKSLGLDQLVYFSWGPTTHISSGQPHYLIDSNILLSDQVVVTEHDITASTFGGTGTIYDELTTDKKKSIKRIYFGKMLTGKDWLDLISRRVLLNLKNGDSLFDVKENLALGEVKVLHKVLPKYIVGKPKGEMALSRALKNWYEHGISIDGKIPKHVGKLDINLREASRYWRNLVGTDFYPSQ